MNYKCQYLKPAWWSSLLLNCNVGTCNLFSWERATSVAYWPCFSLLILCAHASPGDPVLGQAVRQPQGWGPRFCLCALSSSLVKQWAWASVAQVFSSSNFLWVWDASPLTLTYLLWDAFHTQTEDSVGSQCPPWSLNTNLYFQCEAFLLILPITEHKMSWFSAM